MEWTLFLSQHFAPLLFLCFIEISVFNENSADPDEGLPSLPVTILRVPRLKWLISLTLKALTPSF